MIIRAPFTDQQVEDLKIWQSTGVMHPFTCGGCDRNRDDQGILIPMPEGWICPCGEYTQDWCHDFMLNDRNK